jgi:Arc/MetJ-type ribon-helix-helix transcriptional regulator
MKRINIYIKENEDKTLDQLSDLLGSNRSEVIRNAVKEFADNRRDEIAEFLEGLDYSDDEESTEDKITHEQLHFYKQCIDNPIFFAENAIKCNIKDVGLSSLKLTDAQKSLLSEVNHRKRTIVNKSRQIGGTLIELINIAHYMLSNRDKTIVLMSNKLTTSSELLRTLRDLLDTLPEYMKLDLVTNSKRELKLDNGCRVLSTACSVDGLRGIGIDYLLIDEAAYVKREIFDELVASVFPILLSGKRTEMHIISSPNGPNHFMKLFTDAVCNYTNFYAMEIPWDVGGLSTGDKSTFKEDMVALIGLYRFQQEYECKFLYRGGIEDGI